MSTPQYSQQPQQAPERHSHTYHGVMGFRSLCKRLDMDNLKAKLPNLSQLKLPQSLPKLRTAGRFFHSSSNVTERTQTHSQSQLEAAALSLPKSEFINRTPQRISTISTLMHEQLAGAHSETLQLPQPNTGTYRSAGSLEDDYYTPFESGAGARVSRPISPIEMPASIGSTVRNDGRNILVQRLQHGYKSLSELRLKHVFAKKTTIRRDDIDVDRYVEQYDSERRVEQLAQVRRDRKIADNYDIHICTLPVTRQNTLQQKHIKNYEKEDESKLAHKRSVSEYSGDESGMEESMPPTKQRQKARKRSGIAATRFAKVRQPPLTMPTEVPLEEPNESPTMRNVVRQNLKRLRRSIKRAYRPDFPNTDEDNKAEEDKQRRKSQPKPRQCSTATLHARLRRYTSRERIQQRWRKSFNNRSEAKEKQAAETAFGAGIGVRLERTLTKLNEKIKQLKLLNRAGVDKRASQVVNKFNTVGCEPDEIDDGDLDATYHSESSDDDEDKQVAAEPYGRLEAVPKMTTPMSLVKHQTMATLIQLQGTRSSTAWSSESLEEDTNIEQQVAGSDYARVLIHQQHTDANESTLIIAVASTPSPSPSPSPTSETVKNQWVSNQQIIADFKSKEQSQLMWPAASLYKAKSIDIFDGDGDAVAAFADFDEELRNAPVLRISAGRSSFDSNEDADDGSSRVTRIWLQSPKNANSYENLMEQQPLEDEDQHDNQCGVQRALELEIEIEHAVSERPPSMSPPPPPLPQRRAPPSSDVPIYDTVPPPLPVSKPPIATVVAASTVPDLTTARELFITAPLTHSLLPDLSASMRRPVKPLVKTSSLRLTYNEQMHPGNVGKVNKLISRFEGGRTRLSVRRLHSEELTISSDGDDNTEKQMKLKQQQLLERNQHSGIPKIVTTQPQLSNSSISNNNINENNNSNEKNVNKSSRNLISSEVQLTLSLDRQNSKCSCSEYGSPLAYPLDNSHRRRSSTPTNVKTLNAPAVISAPQQRHQARRRRRSMMRDEDNFYSFDSDEENSYYSISPSSSSRYVVEI